MKIYSLIPEIIHDIPYSLPSNASMELKKRIHAALLIYSNDNYELTDYSDIVLSYDDETYQFEDNEKRDIGRDVLITVIEDFSKLVSISIKDSPDISHQYYFLAMGRLVTTFEGCLVLLRRGYYIEATPLFRLIFEQIAWATKIVGWDHDKIKKSKTTKYIEELNKLIDGASKNYGRYTKGAHLDFENISDYFMTGDNNSIGYRTRSGKKSFEKYDDLFYLGRLYIESVEIFFNERGILDEHYYFKKLDNEEFDGNMTVREYIHMMRKIHWSAMYTSSDEDGRSKFKNKCPQIVLTESGTI